MTPGGFATIQRENKALRAALAALNGMSEPVRSVDNLADWASSFGSDSDILRKMIRDRENLLFDVRIVESPKQAERIQFGHMVRVTHSQNECLTFVLGGDGESPYPGYKYQGVPISTFYIGTEFGTEFKGAEVGDTIETKYKGKDVSMTVVEIIIPTDEHLIHRGETVQRQNAAAA